MPLTRSSPASSAVTSGGIQLAFSSPPTFATPMTTERAPFARASAAVRVGSPTVTAPGPQAISPMQRSAAQSRSPKAVLA
jgi:hypothetical protein